LPVLTAGERHNKGMHIVIVVRVRFLS